MAACLRTFGTAEADPSIPPLALADVGMRLPETICAAWPCSAIPSPSAARNVALVLARGGGTH